ncbi:uncharacterized protein K452DRAFT_301859 [Aplosporella prunicola CBS 121167]|uniref:Uncharacterized protein n=1 Tax=Aplosporella prunicola CBS 121167 TaxID=1176127 RepID=A0A6A6B0S2_9PEZI|nr:uncharacterized protein K452DRAFT_301859 [Aplosporella prunicola CBS 121167]KAF2137456.1 hypothetical protein K452DRAFT_301859 [Aplosporella prunicola CBS 121167]
MCASRYDLRQRPAAGGRDEDESPERRKRKRISPERIRPGSSEAEMPPRGWAKRKKKTEKDSPSRGRPGREQSPSESGYNTDESTRNPEIDDEESSSEDSDAESSSSDEEREPGGSDGEGSDDEDGGAGGTAGGGNPSTQPPTPDLTGPSSQEYILCIWTCGGVDLVLTLGFQGAWSLVLPSNAVWRSAIAFAGGFSGMAVNYFGG